MNPQIRLLAELKDLVADIYINHKSFLICTLMPLFYPLHFGEVHIAIGRGEVGGLGV